MKRNDFVRQVMPAPIEGQVSGFQVDQETGDKLVHVVSADGSARFFKESDLEVMEENPADAQQG